MEKTMRSVLLPLIGFILVTAPVIAAADEVPVVVAVDTSRSLSAAHMAEIRAALAEQLDRLPATTPSGLVAFNDDAQWVVPLGASPAAVRQALEELRPEGNYTVLHDALFLTARELTDGGVVLLASDGRDENSATTVEDVGRLCDEQEVRIVAVAVGQRVDERALRRLGLLTEGTYVGALRAAEAEPIAAAVAAARSGVETALRQAAEQEARLSQPPAPQPVATETAEAPARGMPSWLLPLLLIVVVVVVVVLWMALRQRPRDVSPYEMMMDEEPEQATEAMEPVEEEEEEEAGPSDAEVAAVAAAAGSQPVATAAVPDESLLDPKVFDKAPLPPGLEQTMVLDELPVLTVRQAGKPARSYTLPRDQIFAVGRAPKVNTLAVEDPAISGQHFKIVPKDEAFFVVDLGATNGTAVNHKKIRKMRRLEPGDVITAGTVDFEFKVSVKRVT
jgi:hypothetical protein